MAEPWPLSLQDKLNEDSFSLKDGNTVLRSDMDVGPAKVRRRTTRSVDVMTCSIDLTATDYAVFQTFYKTQLNGGVNRFVFNHPITQVPTEFRFSSEPSYRSLGGGNFRVLMEWEILP